MTIRSASLALRKKGELGDIDVLRYDPQQGRQVTTPEAKDALKDYQAKQGLDVTGKWDRSTLAALQKSPQSFMTKPWTDASGTPSSATAADSADAAASGTPSKP